MSQDAQSHRLSGADPATAGHIDDAVCAFTLNYGDANAHLISAQEVSPNCSMAEILRAWTLILSNDHKQIAKACEALAKLPSNGLTERETNHVAARSIS